MGQVLWERTQCERIRIHHSCPYLAETGGKGKAICWGGRRMFLRWEKKGAAGWTGTKEDKSTCMQNFPNPWGSECKVFLENADEVLTQGLVTLSQRRKFKRETALTDICTQTLVRSLCIYGIRQNEIGSCPASSASVPKKRGKIPQQHDPVELNFYCLAPDSNPAHKTWTLRDALQPCSCGWAAGAVPQRPLRPNQI